MLTWKNSNLLRKFRESSEDFIKLSNEQVSGSSWEPYDFGSDLLDNVDAGYRYGLSTKPVSRYAGSCVGTTYHGTVYLFKSEDDRAEFEDHLNEVTKTYDLYDRAEELRKEIEERRLRQQRYEDNKKKREEQAAARKAKYAADKEKRAANMGLDVASYDAYNKNKRSLKKKLADVEDYLGMIDRYTKNVEELKKEIEELKASISKVEGN